MAAERKRLRRQEMYGGRQRRRARETKLREGKGLRARKATLSAFKLPSIDIVDIPPATPWLPPHRYSDNVHCVIGFVTVTSGILHGSVLPSNSLSGFGVFLQRWAFSTSRQLFGSGLWAAACFISRVIAFRFYSIPTATIVVFSSLCHKLDAMLIRTPRSCEFSK